ncbi:MAG: protoporphyrinogen oxidase [Acidobacteria bacterium]|nr:protoporphyrinogen oxidase [Acidobacteriota bacterium]
MIRFEVAIIGGGISGLATAYYLRCRQPQLSVAVLEASRQWGGKIITERTEGRVIECGPDSFLTSKPDILELTEQLGLADELVSSIENNSRTLVLNAGKLVAIPEGFFLLAPMDLVSFWKSPLFSFAGKLSVCWERFRPPKRNVEDESIGSFVRRRFGEEALRLLGAPLLAGIYMGDPDRLSIHSTFPQLVEMERRRGSVTAALQTRKPAAGGGHSLFVSFRHGMDTLPRTLVSRLNVPLLAERQARKLVRHGSGYRILTANDEIYADRVVIAVDPLNAYSLLESADPIEELKKFCSVSSIVVILVYGPEVSLPDAYGMLFPRTEGKQITALSFSSKKFPGRAPAGESMLRVFLGGYDRETVLEKDDHALLEIVATELREILGITDAPCFVRIVRWNRANPQYTVGHRQRMERIDQALRSLPGVYLLGSAYGGVGIPDCVAQAKQTAVALTSS